MLSHPNADTRQDASSIHKFSTASSSFSSSGRSNQRQYAMERNLLPLVNSFLYRYPVALTAIAMVIELMQCWAFALNPHNPGHHVTWCVIYAFQAPFWDGTMTVGGFPYTTFTIFYWIVVAVLCATLVVLALGVRNAHWAIHHIIDNGFLHLFNFLLSIFYIPTIQTLLSGFMCQKRSPLDTIQLKAANVDSTVVFVPYVLFFPDTACDASKITVAMAVSIVLLVIWGCTSYFFTMMLIPVDHEDACVRRRFGAVMDMVMFVYKTGLCITFFLTQSYNARGTGALVVALTSFLVAILYSFFLPFYAEWANRLHSVAFAAIGWSGMTEYIAYRQDTEMLVQQGGIYLILVFGGLLVVAIFFVVSGLRYDRRTKHLFAHATSANFVPITKNPFAAALLQCNSDLLPFPHRLPKTDAQFSVYHSITLAVLDEGLHEEAEIFQQDALGAGGAAAPRPRTNAAVEGEEDGSAKDADETRAPQEVLLEEATRRQVVCPTISTAWVPTDAEVASRFLSDWQTLTETFPTPHMVSFASRMFNRFLLKYPRSGTVLLAYISFLCDYAPSLTRMTLCLELARSAIKELSPSLTERFLFFYFSLHVRESLGIRNLNHQALATRIRKQHEGVLLSTALVWRNLLEETRSPVSIYYFTSHLATARWRCFQAYVSAMQTITSDEAFLRSVGIFMRDVYGFRYTGQMCDMVADTVAHLHLLRLQKAFQNSGQAAAEAVLDARERPGKHVKDDDGGKGEGAGSGGDADSEYDGQVSELDEAASTSHMSSAASGNSSARVSSVVTSEGRSSQSKARNSKHLAEQMVEKILFTIYTKYSELTSNLHWDVLTWSGIASLVIILAAIVICATVFATQLQEWGRLREATRQLSISYSLVNMILAQIYKTTYLLPSDESAGLSADDMALLTSNITYLTALIASAEASHSEVFYGTKRVDFSDLHERLTMVSGAAHIYMFSDIFRDIQVSYLTHMPTILSTARRIVTTLQSQPTFDVFANSMDLLMITDNIQVTFASTNRDLTTFLTSSISNFSRLSIIVFALCMAISVVLVAGAGYLLMWNYRRASSIISKELSLFQIIPRESVRRISAEAHERLETFVYLNRSEHGLKITTFDDEEDPNRNITNDDLVNTFGRRTSVPPTPQQQQQQSPSSAQKHGSGTQPLTSIPSVKLLEHLIEHGGLGTSHANDVPSSPGKAAAANAEALGREPGSSASITASNSLGGGTIDTSKGVVYNPLVTPMAHTGHSLESSILHSMPSAVTGGEPPAAPPITEVRRLSDSLPVDHEPLFVNHPDSHGRAKETNALVAGTAEGSGAFALLNVFEYHKHKSTKKHAKAGDDPAEASFSASDAESDGEGDAAEAPEDSPRLGRMAVPVVVCLLLSVGGFVALVIGAFSISPLSFTIKETKAAIQCAMDVGETIFPFYYYAARFVTGSLYDDYTEAEDLLVQGFTVLNKCRNLLNSSQFFSAQHMWQINILISLALVGRNRIELLGTTPEKLTALRTAYALVADLKWDPFPRTASMIAELLPYMSQQQLAAWAPYSESTLDYQLTAPARSELAIQTILGPFGNALMGNALDSYTTMFRTTMDIHKGKISAAIRKTRAAAIAAVVLFGLALIVSLVCLVVTRRHRLIFVFSVICSLCSVVAIVVGSVLLHRLSIFDGDQALWLDGMDSVMAELWQFTRVLGYTISCPFVEDDVLLYNLIELNSYSSLQKEANAFLPQPTRVNPTVFLTMARKVKDARNGYIRNAWFAVVLAVLGRGTSLFKTDPAIQDVRWDVVNDGLYVYFRTLYSSDVFVTTYAADVTASTPAAMLTLAQKFIVGSMFRILASDMLKVQHAALGAIADEMETNIQKAESNIVTLEWVLFAFGTVVLAGTLAAVVILAILSVQSFSRMRDERSIYRIAFGGDMRYIFLCLLFIETIIIVVGILCITFSVSNVTIMNVAQNVMEVQGSLDAAIGHAASLTASASYPTYLASRVRLIGLLSTQQDTYRSAYLNSTPAVELRRNRNARLFGGTVPFMDFSTVPATMLSTSSCADPTRADGGNQNPMLLQIFIVIDLMRSIAYLPQGMTLRSGALVPFANDIYSRVGSIQYHILTTRAATLRHMQDELNKYYIVIAVLFSVCGIVAILTYFCLIRHVEIKVRQQSIGSKLMLLGLPDDILHTVPEVREFYDPEAGNSSDQMKRKLQQSEKLLQNILPPSISRRLKNGERVIADAHQSVTVVFASLTGFEEYSNKLDAKRMVLFLNGIFVAFDHIVDLLDLEKIKTIGDIYFFCGGLTKMTERDHAIRCVECSLFFFQALDDHNSRHSTPNVKLRVGINTDPAVAGVIGNRKVAYDLWGDSVNTASRMYSTGVPGRIQVSDSTFQKVQAYYSFEDRHVQAKGKGTLKTHLYQDRIKSTAYTDINWRVAS